MTKKNEKNKRDNGTAFREIDLTLPEGEWWRPWEDGDEEITIVLLRIKKGRYGDFFVARDLEGHTRFITVHAMLEPIAKQQFLNRVIKLTYLGRSDDGNEAHQYKAELAQGRAARPSRPGRPNAEETASESETES